MTCIETKVAFDITVHFNLLKVESKAEKFDVGIKYAKIPFLLQLFPNMNWTFQEAFIWLNWKVYLQNMTKNVFPAQKASKMLLWYFSKKMMKI